MIRRITLVVAVFFCLVGCKRRPLNDKTDGLYLALEVDYNIKYEPSYNRPETYRVFFFDYETDSLVREEFVAPTGGEISVPAGTYNITAISMGAEYTKTLTNDGYDGCYAYTDLIHWKGYSGGKVIAMPDIIFTGTLENESIPVRGDSGDTYVVHMEAATPIETGKVIVRGVKGTKFISEVTAIVDNLARAKYISSGCVIEEPVAVPMDMEVNTATGELSCVFCSFGKIPNERGLKNSLTLLIEDTGGNKFLKSYDVTDQVYTSDTKDIIIIVDGSDIDIQDPGGGGGGSGGGLEPLIGEWDDIITPVPISFADTKGFFQRNMQLQTYASRIGSYANERKLPTDRIVRLSASCDDDVLGRIDYFKDAEFVYDAKRRNWVSGDEQILWPVYGTLDILGCSSEENLNAEWNESDCSSSVTLTGFNERLSDDLLAACANNVKTGSAPLTLSFNHSKSLIVIAAVTNRDYAITINSIEFSSLETPSGTSSLNITNSTNTTTFSWSNLETMEHVQLPYSYPFVVPMVANEISTILVPAQEAKSFTVNYTLKPTEGEPQDKTYTHDLSGVDWETGKRYTYLLNFNAN